MRQAGKLDGERIAAWIVVLGAHVLFWWVLTRVTSVFTAVDAGADADALQVTWIDPPPAAAVTPVITKITAASPSPRVRDRKVPVQATQRADAARDVPVATAQSSMSAVFIEQGRHWAEAQIGEGDFARDPLANRSASLPGRQADTFRMRKPGSPQAVLRKIGKLFGGPGYTTDPCPQIHANIAGLATGGDGALLQEELRRKRAYCH